ncbi:MAG: hypothetical protein A2Y33_02980 [Spirochaetes bacterium GWF1_51_8]|nr:MAG: hypothetical protein A2Y33_02980 [Spirochaetes bacterium GWF1_51_8]
MYKKRLLVVTFTVLLISLVFGGYNKKESEVKKNPKDIVDFYAIIPGQYIDASIGSLSFKERLDYLTPDENKKVVVDTKNAYLSVSAMPGQFPVNQTIVYFVKSDKTKIIAVSTTGESGECGEYSIFNFYEFKNGKFNYVTDKVIPKLTIDLFAVEKDKKQITEKMNRAMVYKIELPQYGTTCKVYPLGICEIDNSLDPDEYSKFLDIEKRFVFAYLELKWNKQKGKFEFGKKYKK